MEDTSLPRGAADCGGGLQNRHSVGFEHRRFGEHGLGQRDLALELRHVDGHDARHRRGLAHVGEAGGRNHPRHLL
jgi:hypothetical protein